MKRRKLSGRPYPLASASATAGSNALASVQRSASLAQCNSIWRRTAGSIGGSHTKEPSKVSSSVGGDASKKVP
jgi:hypothetical protein